MFRRGVGLLALLTVVAVSPVNSVHGQQGDAVLTQPRIDATRLQETVDTVGAVIAREYMDAAEGARIDRALHDRFASGTYRNINTPDQLARVLTADLYAIAHDKHLAVIAKSPSTAGAASSTPAPSRSDAARRDNGGVRRAEILAGNVAYLDIRYFWRLDEARQAVDAAMQLLSRADALVVDMRNNSGGSPDTVAHLASYLVDGPPATLFEITPRSGTPVTYSSEALSPRLGNLPLFVLTSAHTFSGGEGFAFLLQERGRAEVVGEPTPGAANPGRPYPVNDLFDVVVPNGRLSIAPSGRNWEGTGVAPDIRVPADEALRAAHERALRRLLQAARSDADRQRLDAALQTLGTGHP